MLQMSERRERPLDGVIEGSMEEIDPARHQEILLREMQHRVANSLQIVASILSLKSRTVNSDDARLHLLDACSRVMAVAAVQRQLLESKQPDTIRIGDYLSELGQTLATSLTQEVSLSVIVDTNVAMESSKAVAMGLIVTELVINALRHAFPRQRRGKIVIKYKAIRSGWTLAVSDDGVGVASAPINARGAGHGSKIINMLAEELDACIQVKSDSKGTCVSLIHAVGRNELRSTRGSGCAEAAGR
jgi:chemotaxis protein methyltransferase CheR